MSSKIYIVFLFSSMLIALLPGPAMMLVINHAVRQGYARALQTVAGIAMGDVILLLAVGLGVGALVVSSPQWYNALQWMCAAYLLFLGVRSLWSVYQRHDFLGGSNTGKQPYGFVNGLVTTVINPKTLAFLLAYFPQFIDRKAVWSEGSQWLILASTFVLVVCVVMIFYAVFSHVAGRWLRKARVAQILQSLFGVMLIGIAIEGFTQLMS